MLKSELIQRVINKIPHLPVEIAERGVDQIFECMCEALEKGSRVEVRGFGSFSLRHRQPRKAHNPRTKEKIVTESKYAVHFKAGKLLKERVNQAKSKGIPIVPVKKSKATPQDETSSEINNLFETTLKHLKAY
jgi:integration host factor subunit beta